MLIYFAKWVGASFVMPIMVLTFGHALNQVFVLTFWPGSIVLMSLGAEERSTADILYAWSLGIGLNIVLYLILGAVVKLFVKMVQMP